MLIQHLQKIFSSLSYLDSGVNIDAGSTVVECIKPLAQNTARTGSMGGLGGFGALFDLKAVGISDPILVSGTDGVGTKLMVIKLLEKISFDCKNRVALHYNGNCQNFPT